MSLIGAFAARCRPQRTPLLLQTEVAECGLACLVMVARYHGSRLDLPGARSRFPVSPRGLTLADLMATASAMGLSTRAVKLDLDALGALTLPCVLHWDFDHFVVLTRFDGRRATIHDPAEGRRGVPLAALSRHFTGVALELAPGPAFDCSGDRRLAPWRALAPSLAGMKPALTQLLALTVLLQLLLLLGPLHVQWLVDDLLASRDTGWIIALAAGFALLVVLQATVSAMRGWLVIVAGLQINLRMFSLALEHMVRLPMAWFLKRRVADIIGRFSSIDTIQRTLASGFIEALVDGAMLLLSLAMMVYCAPLLALIAVAVGLLYAALRAALGASLRAVTEESITRNGRRAGHLMETVRGMQTVKLFVQERQRARTGTRLATDYLNSELRAERLRLAGQTGCGLLLGLEGVTTLSLGAMQVLGVTAEPVLTVGTLLAFIAYKTQFMQRLGTVVEKGVELRLLALHAERVSDITDTQPEPEPAAAAAHSLPARPDIELRGVSYRYASGEMPVLDDATARIDAGECVAIVGASGCGKTTLLKLMLGLLTPTDGEVLIGGVPLGSVDAAAYRASIGTVMQDDMLFAGSIAQNISFFAEEPDWARIETCARMASVHDDVTAMAMGYRTLVGDMGSVLSGGQKQRILIARALYRRPRILLLDEATSHLDTGAEALINRSVAGMGITRVIVAHRPQTIAAADRVLALEGGRLTPVAKPASAIDACDQPPSRELRYQSFSMARNSNRAFSQSRRTVRSVNSSVSAISASE